MQILRLMFNELMFNDSFTRSLVNSFTRSFVNSSTNSLTNQPNVAFRHEVCALGGLRHSVRLCAVGGCIVINYLARKGNKKNRNSQISLIFC